MYTLRIIYTKYRYTLKCHDCLSLVNSITFFFLQDNKCCQFELYETIICLETSYIGSRYCNLDSVKFPDSPFILKIKNSKSSSCATVLITFIAGTHIILRIIENILFIVHCKQCTENESSKTLMRVEKLSHWNLKTTLFKNYSKDFYANLFFVHFISISSVLSDTNWINFFFFRYRSNPLHNDFTMVLMNIRTLTDRKLSVFWSLGHVFPHVLTVLSEISTLATANNR